jgi:hypothetical protein
MLIFHLILKRISCFNSPGICLHHKVFAMHSEDYLYPLKQTTFRMLQIATITHNSHANEVDICLVLLHEALQRVNFPYQQLTSRLQNFFFIKQEETLSFYRSLA